MQAGHGHVNCHTNEYVIGKMALRGFELNYGLSARTRRAPHKAPHKVPHNAPHKAPHKAARRVPHKAAQAAPPHHSRPRRQCRSRRISRAPAFGSGVFQAGFPT